MATLSQHYPSSVSAKGSDAALKGKGKAPAVVAVAPSADADEQAQAELTAFDLDSVRLDAPRGLPAWLCVAAAQAVALTRPLPPRSALDRARASRACSGARSRPPQPRHGARGHGSPAACAQFACHRTAHRADAHARAVM